MSEHEADSLSTAGSASFEHMAHDHRSEVVAQRTMAQHGATSRQIKHSKHVEKPFALGQLVREVGAWYSHDGLLAVMSVGGVELDDGTVWMQSNKAR